MQNSANTGFFLRNGGCGPVFSAPPEPVAIGDELFGNDAVFQVNADTEITILTEELPAAGLES